ncbi:MAG: hypothetical protein O3A00_16510 [Planctomycetota bacterium]|nr:hypothetical protein [Planctomycetota bacterium]
MSERRGFVTLANQPSVNFTQLCGTALRLNIDNLGRLADKPAFIPQYSHFAPPIRLD